ncbi:MAG: DUF3037 domain-containing protein [Aeromonas sp.]
MTHQILYAIVQFRPYRETEEFANVGVVLCAPQAGHFDFALEVSSFSRITTFFPALDRQLPKRATHYMANELARVRRMVQMGSPSAEGVHRLFQEATKAKEGVIYFSAARPALMHGTLPEILEALYRHHVHHSFAKRPSANDQLEHALRELLERHNMRNHYQLRTLEDAQGFVRAKIPFTHQKEGKTVRAIRPLSMLDSSPSKIVELAEQWSWRFRRLFDAQILEPAGVLVPLAMPSAATDPRIEPAINAAQALFQAQRIRVLPTENDAAIIEFAAQI